MHLLQPQRSATLPALLTLVWWLSGDMVWGVCQFGVDDPRPLNDRIYEVAFNSDRKFMEVVCQRGPHHCTYVKGILEAILPNCESYVGPDGSQVRREGGRTAACSIREG